MSVRLKKSSFPQSASILIQEYLKVFLKYTISTYSALFCSLRSTLSMCTVHLMLLYLPSGLAFLSAVVVGCLPPSLLPCWLDDCANTVSPSSFGRRREMQLVRRCGCWGMLREEEEETGERQLHRLLIIILGGSEKEKRKIKAKSRKIFVWQYYCCLLAK